MCTERYIDPFTDFGFKRMFGAEVSNLSPEEYEAYEMSLKRQRDNYNIVATAREEGGRERDIQRARKMKIDGLPVDSIMRYTELTPEEINEL